MEIIQIVGMTAGVLTAVSMLPQLIKIIKEKHAEDVSLIMLIVLVSGLSLWVVYGVMREDIPLIATNSFSILVNITTIILRLKYSKSKT